MPEGSYTDSACKTRIADGMLSVSIKKEPETSVSSSLNCGRTPLCEETSY